MAPPKLVTRRQLEIMVDFMCENKDLLSRVPQTALVQEESQQKWASLAEQLNDVPGGTIRSPILWKRYWIEWRYRVKKKDVQKFDCDKKCLVPMNDLDFRVLELCKPSSSFRNNSHINKSIVQQKQKENSNTEVFMPIIKSERTSNSVVREENTSSRPRISIDVETSSPPPQWALDLEDRRIATEERVADALESIANLMRTQEERRSVLEERMIEAVMTMTRTVQDLNNGVQEAVQLLRKTQPTSSNGINAMENVFIVE